MVPPRLSLFDSVCLMVGIIVGAGIFQVSPAIASSTNSTSVLLSLWVVGGVLSLCGALGYAELAAAYPGKGGDYAYLNRAYGPMAGFLFGWIQMFVIRPGDIALMAFIVATYACTLWKPYADLESSRIFYAAFAVILCTVFHLISVRSGKLIQNLLTTAKLVGILIVVILSFSGGSGNDLTEVHSQIPLSIALILVLFSYGGWNEIAYVATEVTDFKRNVVRAMVLGVGAVTVVYLTLTAAFLYSLGHTGMSNSESIAVDSIAKMVPEKAECIVALLICYSAMGAVNGLIFTGGRIFSAMGNDYPLLRFLAGSPTQPEASRSAFLLQGGLALLLIFALGGFLNSILYTSATVYGFYFFTSLGVMILRKKDPSTPRPYRVTGYPFTTILFCLVSLYLIYQSICYKPMLSLVPLAFLILGIPFYWICRTKK